MNSFDLETLTITEAGDLIGKGDLSPVELTQATLERIERIDPLLRAFITVTPEYAMERARQAEQEIAVGQHRGPLHGVPYTLKDIIPTAGIRTTFGHPRLKDFKPKESATVHNLLEDAGAVLVGKVYSLLGRGDGPIECYSPWDPTTSPGTSSCGSGSAVAASLCLLSIGSDTGGSVRHPASNCGLVGMKATFGRISRFGIWAASWSTDQAGPLTKTVEDNALALQTLAGYDPKDPVTIHAPVPDYRSTMRDGIRGLRVGLPVDHWVWKQWVDEDEEDAVRKAVDVLEELGADVHEVALPLSVGSRENSLVAEAPVYFEDNFSKEDLEEWHELHPQLERGRQQTFAEYIHGQNKRAAIRQEITGVLTQVDVIAMPTGSTIGDKAEAATAVIRGRELPARSRAVYLNGMASQAGVPALSVLCGFAKEGRFPVGLQLIGRDLDEALLYRVAYSYEQATEWHMRHPSL